LLINYMVKRVNGGKFLRFENEIRVILTSEEFKSVMRRIKELNGEVVREYKFYDHVFKPKSGEWSLERKILRVREWFKPSIKAEILFTHIEIVEIDEFKYKRTIYPQGKILMYTGNKEEAFRILEDLGFEYWFTVYKEWGGLYKLKRLYDKIIALEYVKDLGYSLEVEIWGSNVEQVKHEMTEILGRLGIKKDKVLWKSLPTIVAEHLKLIRT